MQATFGIFQFSEGKL